MKVQEALKAAKTVICEGIYSEDGMDGDDGERVLRIIDAALSEIGKCEAVGELILAPAFLPALKAPLVNWKINLVDLEVGAKFYTSPISKEWLGLSDQQIREIKNNHPNNLVKATEAKLKQLNVEKG